MAVQIRMKRVGAINRSQWRIVVADVKMPRDGRFIEEIGSYDPLPLDEKFKINKDRLEYWLGQGARLSPSVKSLIKRAAKKTKKLTGAKS